MAYVHIRWLNSSVSDIRMALAIYLDSLYHIRMSPMLVVSYIRMPWVVSRCLLSSLSDIQMYRFISKWVPGCLRRISRWFFKHPNNSYLDPLFFYLDRSRISGFLLLYPDASLSSLNFTLVSKIFEWPKSYPNVLVISEHIQVYLNSFCLSASVSRWAFFISGYLSSYLDILSYI